MSNIEEFEWTFTIKDLVNFDGASITVYAPTYEQAIKKIRTLKLPDLRTYDNIADGLKLTQVIEFKDQLDDDAPLTVGEDEDNPN